MPLLGLIRHPSFAKRYRVCSSDWHRAIHQSKRVGFRSLKVKTGSVFTRGRDSCLFQLFLVGGNRNGDRQRQRRRRRSQLLWMLQWVVHSLWMREQSNNWWELLMGAADLSVNAVTFLSFGCQHRRTLCRLHVHLQDFWWHPVIMQATITRSVHSLIQRMLSCCALRHFSYPHFDKEC